MASFDQLTGNSSIVKPTNSGVQTVMPSPSTSNENGYDEVFNRMFGRDPFMGLGSAQEFIDYAKGQGYDFTSGTHSYSTLTGLIEQFKLDQLEKQYGNDYKGLEHAITEYFGGNSHITSDYEKWLDNMIASQNTSEAQNWEEKMRDTDLTSTANQLSQLGLPASSVLSVGRAATPNVDAANNVSTNLAQKGAEIQAARKQAILKAVTGMISSSAAAGIGGASLGFARSVAGNMLSSTTKSMNESFNMLKAQNEKYRNAFMALGAKMSLR